MLILDFKTTWSEFQMSNETAATRGHAKLHMINFKTTWSEFQKPNQTAGQWISFWTDGTGTMNGQTDVEVEIVI